MWTFRPILKSTIWGGERIAPFKGIITDRCDVGESWELSGVPGSESTVASGPDEGLSLTALIEKYQAELMGSRNYVRFGTHFPLLIKFIDAREDLSVQVHPDDAMAQKYGEPNGKTEMWYVLDAEKGARLANGFNRVVDPSEYEELVETGKIEEVLNFEPISSGDVFYIPAGRVHAIGKGAFVAEVQQTSDATYRLYDYHRKDAQGNERELHTALAKEAIRFDDTDGSPVAYTPVADIPVNVVNSPYFTTNILSIDREVMRDYKEKDTFVILIATEGEAMISCGEERLLLKSGNTVLIPARTQGIVIEPRNRFVALETYMG